MRGGAVIVVVAVVLAGCAAGPSSPGGLAGAFVGDLLKGDCQGAYALAVPTAQNQQAEQICEQGMPEIIRDAYSCWPLSVGRVYVPGYLPHPGPDLAYEEVQVRGVPRDEGWQYSDAQDPNPDPRYAWMVIDIALVKTGNHWYVDPTYPDFQQQYSTMVTLLEKTNLRC